MHRLCSDRPTFIAAVALVCGCAPFSEEASVDDPSAKGEVFQGEERYHYDLLTVGEDPRQGGMTMDELGYISIVTYVPDGTPDLYTEVNQMKLTADGGGHASARVTVGGQECVMGFRITDEVVIVETSPECLVWKTVDFEGTYVRSGPRPSECDSDG